MGHTRISGNWASTSGYSMLAQMQISTFVHPGIEKYLGKGF